MAIFAIVVKLVWRILNQVTHSSPTFNEVVFLDSDWFLQYINEIEFRIAQFHHLFVTAHLVECNMMI